VAGDAEAAFAVVRRFEPDLILYDLELPGYDGFEALRLVSRMRGARGGKIVASSIHKGQETARRAREAGAWEFAPRPLEADFLYRTARAIRRHLHRPRELPESTRNGALKLVRRRCPRAGCGQSTVGFQLRPNTMRTSEDQFETTIYRAASRGHEFVDYQLLSVTVCPRCYYALDEAAPRARSASPGGTSSPGPASSSPGGQAPRERPGGQAPRERPDGAARDRQRAAEPAGASGASLLRLGAEADDSLFTEERSPAAAVTAFRLAAANLEADTGQQPGGRDLSALADLYLKGASVAHFGGDESMRDRLFADAEKACGRAVELEGCREVYRAAYRLVALYVFFGRDADADEAMGHFERFEKPRAGRMRPRESRILAKYRKMAERLLCERDMHRRSNYFPR